MIKPEEFFQELKKHNINFFAGVPDSLLKDFNAYIMDNAPSDRHIIAANEGGAIGLATGHYLATRNPALVYMQNSGQGNALNPLTSLTDKEVYGIPMLLLIGWRGEPGVHDEPQHVKQGRVTLSLLDTLEIPHSILPENIEQARETLSKAVLKTKETNQPYALIARKGTFEPYELKNKLKSDFELVRESALKTLLSNLNEKDIIVSTTGMLSRELFEARESQKQGHARDFLTVGSMGHSSQIALGIALAKPERNVYCLDGDGALIMHLGSLAIIGQKAPKNFRHIVFNNFAHDSVGGQPTASSNINIPQIAKACGYRYALTAKNQYKIGESINFLKNLEGPSMLEIKIASGSRKDLGRPTKSPSENKNDFMNNLSK